MAHRQRLREILRYGLVGAVGFGVDGGLLYGLAYAGMSPYFARAISFPLAVSVTWFLHRFWTFETGTQMEPKRQYTRFFVVQVIAALANYVAYIAVLARYGIEPSMIAVGFMLGSALGLVVNYAGAKWLVFRASGEGDP